MEKFYGFEIQLPVGTGLVVLRDVRSFIVKANDSFGEGSEAARMVREHLRKELATRIIATMRAHSSGVIMMGEFGPYKFGVSIPTVSDHETAVAVMIRIDGRTRVVADTFVHLTHDNPPHQFIADVLIEQSYSDEICAHTFPSAEELISHLSDLAWIAGSRFAKKQHEAAEIVGRTKELGDEKSVYFCLDGSIVLHPGTEENSSFDLSAAQFDELLRLAKEMGRVK